MIYVRSSERRSPRPLLFSPRNLQVHTRSGRHTEIPPINRPVIFGALETPRRYFGGASASPLLDPERLPRAQKCDGHTQYITENTERRRRRRDDDEDDEDDDGDDGADERRDSEQERAAEAGGEGAPALACSTMHHVVGGTGPGRDSVHSVGNRDTFARISAF